MNDYEKEELKTYLKEHCDTVLEQGQGRYRDFYICPFCHSGAKANRTPAFHLFKDDKGELTKYKCSACGEYGDIFTLVMKLESVEFTEALRMIQEKYGNPSSEPVKEWKERKQRTPEPPKVEPDMPTEQWQQAIMRIADRAKDFIFEKDGADGLSFLKSRGIDEQTIREYGIGYVPQIDHDKWMIDNGYSFRIPSPFEEGKRIAIPCGITCPFMMEDHLYKLEMRRLPEHLVNDSIDKIGQPKGGTTSLFNGDDALCLDKRRDILFTEGWIDALSINQAVGRWCNDEIKAVTFGGATTHGDSDQFFKWYVMPYRVIVGFDNDDAGRTQSEKLVEKINMARRYAGRSDAQRKFPPEQYKDWNEFLMKDERSVFQYVSDLFPEIEYSHGTTSTI